MMQERDVIANPVTGEKVVFLQTGGDTGGELLQFDMFVEPGGAVAAEHVHPSQTEQFIVKKGELCLQNGGNEEMYNAGDETTIPPGTSHVWWNSGSSELHVRVELRPASRFDAFLRSLFALAQDDKTDAQGLPNTLQLAVMMQEYADVIYPSSPPRSLQKILFAVLAPIGRALGYEAHYPS